MIFRSFGLKNVRILNGGLKKWRNDIIDGIIREPPKVSLKLYDTGNT